MSERDVSQSRAGREFESSTFESLEATASPEAANLTDSEVAGLISQDARDAVIGFEVTSRKVYEKKYINPEAPGGASGITIGIGYDLGHTSKELIKKHWDGLLPPGQLELMLQAQGLQGDAARAACKNFSGITVPWDVAIEVFQRSTMPLFGRKTLAVFPNAIHTKGHAFGALFSLVYNRGDSLSGDRRREMLAIRNLMAAKAFNDVPAQFVAMKRIWQGQADMAGVLKRRDAEAALFRRGLELMEAARTVVAAGGPAGTQSHLESAPGSFERLQSQEDEWLGDGRYYQEQPAGGPGDLHLEAAGWEKVTWSEDTESPDYAHIADRSLTGLPFTFGARELELLIRVNDFAPRRDLNRIVFALRGAQLVASATDPAPQKPQQKQIDRDHLTLQDTRPDHTTQKCVIGVYDLTTQRLSGFSSSTVPHRRALFEYKNGGSSGNMMLTGSYIYTVGWHKYGKPGAIPGCLTEAGNRKAVLRSTNNLRYDTQDGLENHQSHGDNLHPASSDRSASFSSYGCLVVNGSFQSSDDDRIEGTHTGEWGAFRDRLGLKAKGTGDHKKVFDCILLTGLEAAIAAKLVADKRDGDSPQAREQLGRLRQGSQGERVRRLQRGLQVKETGRFDHELAKALADQQKLVCGHWDAIYSPAWENHWRIGVFDPLPAAAIASVQGTGATSLESLEAAGAGHSFEAARAAAETQWHYELGLYTETARRERRPVDDNNLESVGQTNLEFGAEMLTSMGASIARDLELRLKDYVCSQAASLQTDVNTSINSALERGTAAVRDALVEVVVRMAVFLPRRLVEPIVDTVIEKVVKPAGGTTAAMAFTQIGQGRDWLCGAWTANIAERYGIAAPGGPGEPRTLAQVVQPIPQRLQPAGSAPQPPAMSGNSAGAGELVSKIQDLLTGAKPNPSAAQRYLQELHAGMDRGDHAVTHEQTKTLVALMGDPRLLNQTATRVDALTRIDDVVALLKAAPVNAKALDEALGQLHRELGDARFHVPEKAALGVLKALKGARKFDALSQLADRFMTREPELLGSVCVPYAQGLIDSGRLIAAIELLTGAQQSGKLNDEQSNEASGLLGRAHKQIYINFISTADEARTLASRMGHHLDQACQHYAAPYDPAQPGKTYYQGINLVAMQKRAERDHIEIETGSFAAKGSADEIATAIIKALEPAAEASGDPWQMATLGEAYLARGDLENAARWYGRYAQLEKVSAFELASTTRQLEQVWQLHAETSGAGAIITNLKAALAAKENGVVNLRPVEQRALMEAVSVQFNQYFEAKTANGDFISFGLLREIVRRGGAVAAIQKQTGGLWENHGTAFVVKGSEFSNALSAERTYLLTNAHVMWDHAGAKDGGVEEASGKQVDSKQVRIVFEADQTTADVVSYRCERVVWQSASSRHDAVLFELDRVVPVERAAPLDIAPKDYPLNASSMPAAASKLYVLGHAGGRSLSISFVGSLEKNGAMLLDKGPRGPKGDPVYLHYSAPTEGGNSGSPVFSSASWKVVALHHAGSVDPGIPKLNGKDGLHPANEGIWIQSIREAVKTALQPRRRWWQGRLPDAS